MTEQRRTQTALVVGGGRGLGRGVVTALTEKGFAVTAIARSQDELADVAAATGATSLVADAASEAVAVRTLAALRPHVTVIVAGATPTLRPLHEHTWETFTKTWEVDTRIAFEWVRASLLLPLGRDAHVIVFSSGAALQGSTLSGGYAGAKRAAWFLTEYAAEEARRLDLGVRFSCLIPALNPSTELGKAAIHAYAARANLTEEAYASRFAPYLTPSGAGAAVLALVEKPADWPKVAYRLTGSGMREVP